MSILATAQKESGGLALGLPFPLKWAVMFVFLILAAEAGGWAVEVCMACLANTVLTAFQGILQ